MRLNAYLARTGVASRRGADELIKRGRVRVNGKRGELNTFVGVGDVVDLDGRLLVPQPLAYVLLHKPAGVVTTASDPHGRATVVGLVEHEAEVEGEPSDEALAALEQGLDLDDGPTAPARARRLGPSHLELSIHEGRKHQVKRMLEAVGHPVRRLHRRRYAGLTTEGLEPGEWRELRNEEVASLRELTRRT